MEVLEATTPNSTVDMSMSGHRSFGGPFLSSTPVYPHSCSCSTRGLVGWGSISSEMIQ